jgi:hypothetical protein
MQAKPNAQANEDKKAQHWSVLFEAVGNHFHRLGFSIAPLN